MGGEESEDEHSITDDVRGANYYHGLLPRVDIEPLLKKDGDFIVRKTEVNGAIVLALSVRHEKGVKHFMINQTEDGTAFYIEDHRAKTVSELVNYYRITKKPLSATCGARLRRPIERPEWLLTHDSILCTKKLGEGAFGEVYLGEFNADKEHTKVAVKTMRGEANREARIKFMKEARLMRRFKHNNVVRIYGVAVYESPLMIVMEFCPVRIYKDATPLQITETSFLGGALLNYLRNNKGKVTQSQKLNFILEAAEGLAFLEHQKVVHRDIAARNCLLTEKNEVKISDFGMSDERQIIQDEKLEKVPVKWLAKETLEHRIYSLKTDVWAYGIMCWEVYADGAEPYPGLTNIQTRAKIVIQDYRMEMPKDTPPKIAKLVYSCWDKDPKKRPEFAKITQMLKEMK